MATDDKIPGLDAKVHRSERYGTAQRIYTSATSSQARMRERPQKGSSNASPLILAWTPD